MPRTARAQDKQRAAQASSTIHREDIESLPDLMALTGGALRSALPFIVFCDDLAFEAEDTSYNRSRRCWKAGLEGRPENVRLLRDVEPASPSCRAT